MSKSLGNSIEPQDVTRQSGAEILRLWAALVDYAEDQRIGPTILQTTIDAYRKLRNTVRYLLGALAGFEAAERVDAGRHAAAGALHPAPAVGAGRPGARAPTRRYAFQDVWRPLADFCSNDLSALLLRHPPRRPLLRPARQRCAAAPAAR